MINAECVSPHKRRIQHLLAGCPVLLQNGYKARHDDVCKILYRQFLVKYGYNMNPDPYFKLKPQWVLQNRDITLYWDRTIITDATVEHNRPDIIVYNKTLRHVTAIDIAAGNNNNLVSTFNTKIAKYQQLLDQLRNQWNLNSTSVQPIINDRTCTKNNNISD